MNTVHEAARHGAAVDRLGAHRAGVREVTAC
jgi:hypothetical protein